MLRLIYADDPRRLSSARKIDVKDIVASTDREELLRICIDRELNKLRNKKLAEWFDGLKRLVRFDGVSLDDIQRLAEAKAARDILVHNARVVNDIYIMKAGSHARHNVGERIVIEREYFHATWILVGNTVVSTCEGLVTRLCPSDPTANDDADD